MLTELQERLMCKHCRITLLMLHSVMLKMNWWVESFNCIKSDTVKSKLLLYMKEMQIAKHCSIPRTGLSIKRVLLSEFHSVNGGWWVWKIWFLVESWKIKMFCHNFCVFVSTEKVGEFHFVEISWLQHSWKRPIYFRILDQIVWSLLRRNNSAFLFSQCLRVGWIIFYCSVQEVSSWFDQGF